METSGYAAAIADHFDETVHFITFDENDSRPG